MQINLSPGFQAGLPLPPKGSRAAVNKSAVTEITAHGSADQAQIQSRPGLALPTIDLELPPGIEASGVSLSPHDPPSKGLRLTDVDLGGSYLNDSNLFVNNEDDLGMTTSYRAQANLHFADAAGSQTRLNLDHRSALHSQFLSQANNLTEQSLITTQDYKLGVSNNALLGNHKNEAFSPEFPGRFAMLGGAVRYAIDGAVAAAA